MKGADDDILEETYKATRGTLEEAPHPSLQVVRGALDMLSLQYPQARLHLRIGIRWAKTGWRVEASARPIKLN